MGASNALAAYRLYSDKIPPTSLNVLVYMAIVAKDKDTEPWWSQGHDTLALTPLGYEEPVTDAALRAVSRAIKPLFDVGAITVERHSAGGDRPHAVRYRLWLDKPATPDGNRRVTNDPTHDRKRRTSPADTRQKTSYVTRRHTTENVPTYDEKRRTEEYEEDLKQERYLKTGIQTSVVGTRTGSAREADRDEISFPVADNPPHGPSADGPMPGEGPSGSAAEHNSPQTGDAPCGTSVPPAETHTDDTTGGTSARPGDIPVIGRACRYADCRRQATPVDGDTGYHPECAHFAAIKNRSRPAMDGDNVA